MNTKIAFVSLLATLGGLAAIPTTARAGTDIHVSFNFSDWNGPYRPSPPPVVVVRPRPPEPRGYWKEITVKTWVPSRWITTYDRRGHPVRVFEKGYFAYRTERVWVGNRDDDRRDDGRRDEHFGDNDRRDNRFGNRG